MVEPPSLPEYLAEKILSIPHTTFPFDFLPYLPASAKLANRSVVDCVFWGSAASKIKWGTWPDRTRTTIELDDVVDVVQSVNQFPPQFANRIYPSVKDDARFTLVMNDGSRFYYLTEPVIDFIEYPRGYGQNDIELAEVGWTPQMGYSMKSGLTPEGRAACAMRRASALHSHPHSFCLFSESSDQLRRLKEEVKELRGW